MWRYKLITRTIITCDSCGNRAIHRIKYNEHNDSLYLCDYHMDKLKEIVNQPPQLLKQ